MKTPVHKKALGRARRKKNPVVRVVVGRDRIDGRAITYQLEKVKCGKATCRKWHGPYWYAYWSVGNRKRTLYIGAKLRPAADVRIERDQRKLQRGEKRAAKYRKEWEARQRTRKT